MNVLKVILPKKSTSILKKKVDLAINNVRSGHAKLRKTTRYGYQTLAISHTERIVIIDQIAYAFSQHSKYEKFINISRG